MGEIKKINSVLLFIAGFSSFPEAIEELKIKSQTQFGAIHSESSVFRFDEFTQYYAQEMGSVLYKKFWAFETLIDPGDLADIKIQTNQWEKECADAKKYVSDRPVNLDPGYIDLGKLILASTKDHGHRIYLQKGIFAETTLMYTQKCWRSLDWTYSDYRSEGYQQYFTECRNYLHERRKFSPK